ncbi:MAG: primosomal protein N', partial [Coriobacteriia bacterium]|nr:primosomal protein N' [Coriobacteriia bacterium]
MPFARVAVDVKTRALAAPFTYTVPARLDASVVPGCCVVVEFGRRPAVGYVLAVDETLDPGLTGARLLPIQQVLSEALFLPEAGEVAQWVAQEYASSLADAVRLFLPPGFAAKMVRDEASGAWALQQA